MRWGRVTPGHRERGNRLNAADVTAQADEFGRKAEDSKTFDHAVRVGLVAYGLVHLIIAGIAIKLAFGDQSGSASGSGALSELAKTPLGGLLLYVAAAGFAALVVWRVIEAFTGHREESGKERLGKRAGSLLKALLYGSLGWTAFKLALGGGSDGGSTDTTTAKIMAMPGGQILVGLVGLAILGYGSRLIYKGLSEGFRDKLDVDGTVGHDGRAYVTLGKVGYTSKGLALFVVAGLFIWAAWTQDPEKSGGLDQALHQVLQQPFGMPVLIAMGLGIGCYGLFCFAWAKHLDR